ncbi:MULTISPECIES: GntR family transcriptional regulator [Kaistia]|uniref:GntR family transcriptional regulator n=1 Tax=Kaistia nematophila TaxID=2994654 RepID=A0A9X3E178_9HYPH|nr:GntR family transcriptional regulator [Kaistia nematophila]MBN9025755.1 GntR family transcriptional regulator [Hyphomicrobiales bacterium]MCX5569814.1 GntR family transcriptional regulator [Kaistia nematophila]
MMGRQTKKPVSGDTHASLEAEIGDALRSAILDGEFAPGVRLIELELATRFNVSQGTIRAALKFLQAEGLVEYRPRRGNFVITVEKSDVYEISMLREALESLGARLAAKRIDDQGREALEELLQAMRTAARTGNRARLTELDFDFHRTVIEISGHRRLMEVYNRLEGQTRMFLRLTDKFYHDPLDIIELHEPLVNAICSGDAEAAFQLANRHADADAEELIESMR